MIKFFIKKNRWPNNVAPYSLCHEWLILAVDPNRPNEAFIWQYHNSYFSAKKIFPMICRDFEDSDLSHEMRRYDPRRLITPFP